MLSPASSKGEEDSLSLGCRFFILTREDEDSWQHLATKASQSGNFPQSLSVHKSVSCHEDIKAQGLECFVKEQRNLLFPQLQTLDF